MFGMGLVGYVCTCWIKEPENFSLVGVYFLLLCIKYTSIASMGIGAILIGKNILF